MVRLICTFCLICITTIAAAQERSRAILVLDASGSMWGQIDGINKITIAQDVISGLLETMPAEQELGLTVYGHRRKGDCGDIETVIEPGGDRRADIAAAVNAIKPKGKTPLSAAVIAAAEALKYTEDRATVILVSDGRETCDFDPCEVGRQLEATGVDFTAHVIGFDVNDPADRAQLQCLAEETGGTFRTASNAGELAEALEVVAEPPAPVLFDLTLRAIEGAGGREIVHGLSWKVTDASGAVLLDSGESNAPRMQLIAGEYTALVTRAKDGATGTRGFVVNEPTETVTVVMPELPPEPRTVNYRAQEGDGGPIIRDQLVWDIYRKDGSAVLETEVVDGGSIDLLPGDYRIEVLRPADEATAEATFRVNDSNQTVSLVLPEIILLATVNGPETAVVGASVQVNWTGPEEKDDFITVSAAGSKDNAWETYTYVRDGNPLVLLMPSKPGDYELRYLQNKGRKVLARQAITVTPVSASITPPADLPVGATVAVDWTGPDYNNDFVAVVVPGSDKWINYTYTKEGAPAALQMPTEVGQYEIIYVMNQDRTVLAREPVAVTDVEFSVSAPATAIAGSTLSVDWVGPDYKNDYIAISEAGTGGSRYASYAYTRDGSPAQLVMPLEPGDYELHYVLSQDREVAASTPLTVTVVTGSISGPTEADAGSAIQVNWGGPGYQNDYVTIANVDDAPKKYANYTYTRTGSPLTLQLPSKPGSYELRYIASGGNGQILARQPIEVNPVVAMLAFEPTATAGSNLVVTWEGPDSKNDYLAISRADDPTGYETYTYTREGSPLILKVPEVPGAYEVRYFMNNDRYVLQKMPLSVR